MAITIKVPLVIQIGAFKYNIVRGDYVQLDEGFRAFANHRTQEICIDSHLSPTKSVVCLIHEVLHIIDRVFSCNLEEDTIDRLANGYTQFLLDGLGIQFDWSDIE